MTLKNQKTKSTAFLVLILTFGVFSFLGTNIVGADPIPYTSLPRIYIRSDGTVDPVTAPIQQVGDMYVFTNNVVNYTLEIQRNNIIIDGAGYCIQSHVYDFTGRTYASAGVILESTTNVTVKDLEIQKYHDGIRIYNSSHCRITQNTLTDNENGITLIYSSNISIETNIITKSIMAIVLGSSNHVNIAGNLITKNSIGINADCNPDSSHHINITGNNITGNRETGIASAGTGIAVYGGIDIVIVGNNIENNTRGVYLSYSNCTIYHNSFIDNTEQFYGSSYSQTDSMGQRQIVWDNGTHGNYWSNYNGIDNDGDGIGDTEHIIQTATTQTEPTTNTPVTHGVNAQDSYPLIQPIAIPEFPNWTIIALLLSSTLFSAIIKKQMAKLNQD
ncbi:MAG: right-handed parallel beta-helix repeat-containing protein [Candidatus Bathyarchaeota archaeon]|nr:right-handed parallel beta-helix repeat-containing protein [Candidatus Bathyarchaeum sp.]